MEQFAFVASHDLQEPLRKVQAFGDRLESKDAQVLGENGLDYLSRMKNAANRMSILINDLLSFSRVGQDRERFVETDLQNVVDDVLEALEQIKSDPALLSIPVDIMTTSREEQDLIRFYKYGASSFITKPVEFDQLVNVLRTFGEYWFSIVKLPPHL